MSLSVKRTLYLQVERKAEEAVEDLIVKKELSEEVRNRVTGTSRRNGTEAPELGKLKKKKKKKI